jgi:hypothetical protein
VGNAWSAGWSILIRSNRGVLGAIDRDCHVALEAAIVALLLVFPLKLGRAKRELLQEFPTRAAGDRNAGNEDGVELVNLIVNLAGSTTRLAVLMCSPLAEIRASFGEEISTFFVILKSVKVALPTPPPVLAEPMLTLLLAPHEKLSSSIVPACFSSVDSPFTPSSSKNMSIGMMDPLLVERWND